MLKQYFSNKTKRFQKLGVVLVVLVVAGIGTYLLTSSHAATPYVSSTADSGTLANGAVKQTCSGASDGSCVVFGSTTTTPTSTGKLLGMNASFGDLPAANTSTLTQLGVNSERGELDLSGSAFADPNNDGTTANWVDTLTANHIVPLPLLNQYIEMTNINTAQFVTATVNWCEAYCAGGSFYSASSQASQATKADATYAPQVLEILNEPYGGGSYWGGAGVYTNSNATAADIAAYALLLKDIRAGLNSAGLSNIGILASSNNNWSGTENWDTDLLSDGGFAAAQGVTIHSYGDTGAIAIPTGTVDSGTEGWSEVYYIHQFLAAAGLSAQANNIEITEDGWCTVSNGGCSPISTESQKDGNIATAINQLATVPWIKGFWYFNLHYYDDTSFGLYSSTGGTAVSGQTPSFAAFQAAAQANGF